MHFRVNKVNMRLNFIQLDSFFKSLVMISTMIRLWKFPSRLIPSIFIASSQILHPPILIPFYHSERLRRLCFKP